MLSVFFCGVSPASRSHEKFVISISGFVTSGGCYGECEAQKAAVSPGNMLRTPPWDESLSCPGVSGLPLRLSRLHASRDRPRLMSHLFLFPASVLISSPVRTILPHWPYLMKYLCCRLFPRQFATPVVPYSGVVQGTHGYMEYSPNCFAFSIAYTHSN